MRTPLTFVVAFVIAAPLAAQWPIEPTGSDHPVGNTFGEYQAGDFFHAGIDILATPQLNADATTNPAAPWVRTTVAGTPLVRMENMNWEYNFCRVDDAGGVGYYYGHLQQNSYHANYVTAFNNGTPLPAGSQVAKIVRWPSCDYHHHHYEIWNTAPPPTVLIGPYPGIAPDADSEPPLVDDIGFAQDNTDPWNVMNPVAAGGCTVVNGNVDIVAKIRDRNAAGSALIGAASNWVRNVRWRACPESAPGCAWVGTHVYDTMPYSWWGFGAIPIARAAFSIRAPWVSIGSICTAEWYYSIVTNFAGGLADAAGRWNTSAVANGPYTVSVEATDFAGNVTIANRRACVQNGGGCITELMIRDAADDSGGIPYPGPVWWESPDITANPGTPDEDVNIRIGMPNPIVVTARNSGSCTIPSGTVYNVCLGWGPPSGTIAYPLPPANVIGCQAITLASNWAVGTPRDTPFSWTPNAMSVPAGHHCLIAWVDMAGDPVMNTPAVNYDDNRAQQNIEFQPMSGMPGESGAFWVNPQQMIAERSLEIRFSASDGQRVRVYLPPTLVVGRVTGGDVAAAKPDEKPYYPDSKLAPCELPCATAEEAQKRGCARVIRGIDADGGRLRIELISVPEPAQVLVEVIGGGGVTAAVVEYGMLREQKEIVPVGGLTIRFVKK
jgi:hypothetical protein